MFVSYYYYIFWTFKRPQMILTRMDFMSLMMNFIMMFIYDAQVLVFSIISNTELGAFAWRYFHSFILYFWKFVSSSSGYVVEESHINAKEKTAVTYTRNLTYPHIMTCEEKCTFSISPDSKNWYFSFILFYFGFDVLLSFLTFLANKP